MKSITLLCIVALGFAACQNNERSNEVNSSSVLTDSASIVDTHTSQISLDWNGTYEGTLPCADCPGIKTTIKLNKNNTFVKHSEYLEKQDGMFTEAGKIEWNENGNTITLISEDGGKQQFKVREGSLLMLNQVGEEVKGALAEHYVLMKKD